MRDSIRVFRKRLLWVLREYALLSPHRSSQRRDEAHQRRIITATPNVMGAFDATQISGTLMAFDRTTSECAAAIRVRSHRQSG
jgi:hypothetical protein